jgi:hypothetical protein
MIRILLHHIWSRSWSRSRRSSAKPSLCCTKLWEKILPGFRGNFLQFFPRLGQSVPQFLPKNEYSRFLSLSGPILLIFLPLFVFNISSILLKCFFCFFCPSRSGRRLSFSLDELELESFRCFLWLSRTLFLRLWSSSLELLEESELEELLEELESSRFFL